MLVDVVGWKQSLASDSIMILGSSIITNGLWPRLLLSAKTRASKKLCGRELTHGFIINQFSAAVASLWWHEILSVSEPAPIPKLQRHRKLIVRIDIVSTYLACLKNNHNLLPPKHWHAGSRNVNWCLSHHWGTNIRTGRLCGRFVLASKAGGFLTLPISTTSPCWTHQVGDNYAICHSVQNSKCWREQKKRLTAKLDAMNCYFKEP